jgi:predicted outer membrane repeat protein
MHTARHRRARFASVLFVLMLLAGSLVAFPAAVSAAGTSVVTNCDDTAAVAPVGSLRAAVEAANADLISTALEPHVITFALPQPACRLITLDNAQLTLARHVSIVGPGAASLTVSGNNASRVFQVNAAVTATISGLTISDGYTDGGAGGGIYNNRGTLTVTSSTISGNTAFWAGGIYNALGTLTVTHSTLSGNEAGFGGGILSDGTLTVTNSTLSGNSATSGGGIYNNRGTLTVTNSTLSGNSATSGGGIYNISGTLTVTNSTLSGNTASTGGGGIHNIGTATVTSSTLSGNSATSSGGGIYNLGTLTLAACIVAGNSATTGPDVFGSIIDGGYNLLRHAAGSTGLTHGDNGNLVGSSAAPLDPVLGSLQDNGGPTETHALLEGSPAINAIPVDGSAGCGTDILTDQRGVARPQGAGCDIGAFEVEFTQAYYQACLYSGSLSQVRFIGDSTTITGSCGRGTPVALLAGGDVGVDVYYACLFAGSLSQVGTSEPSNCGRGAPISLAAGTTLHACLFAGSLSQVSFTPPSSCGRGAPIILAPPTT